MSRPPSPLPAEAIALVQEGRIVEAIKVVREQRGLSLKEAKDALDTYVRDRDGATRRNGASRTPIASEIPGPAIRALENGQLLDAIKRTRETTGLGLKDAKEAVERYLAAHPNANSRFKAASAAELKGKAGKLILVLTLLGLVAFCYQYFISARP